MNALVNPHRASRKAIIRGVAAFEKGTTLSCKQHLSKRSMPYSRLGLLFHSTSGSCLGTPRLPAVVTANHFPTRCITQINVVGVLNISPQNNGELLSYG